MTKFTIRKKEPISEIKPEEKIEEHKISEIKSEEIKSEEKIEELIISHEKFIEDKSQFIIYKYFKGGISQKTLAKECNMEASEVGLIIKEYIEKNPDIKKPNNHPKGEHIKNSKLTIDQVTKIRDEFKNNDNGISFKELAEKYKVSKSTIRNIIRNRIWKI